MIKAGLENVRDNPASSPRQLITSLLDWNLRIDDTEITCLDDGSEFVFYHVSVWNIQAPAVIVVARTRRIRVIKTRRKLHEQGIEGLRHSLKQRQPRG